MRNLRHVLGACLALAACEESTGPTAEGTLVVSVTTIGGDPDFDGYSLTLDGRVALPVAAVATQEFTLEAGRHLVELAEVAANCAIAGDPSREVDLPRGETVTVQFSVECSATGVTVRTTTTGLDLDPNGYRLALDGVPVRTVAANGSAVLSRLSPGSHLLEITEIAPNCQAEGLTTRTVSVVNAELALVEFPVTCRATWAAIRVEASATGSDPDGYYLASLVALPGLATQVTGGSGVILQVPAGTHQVRLDDVATNCTVPGGVTREVTVTTGGTVRDTAEVAFTVECVSDRGTIRVTVATTGSGTTGPHSIYLWSYDCYYCSPVETGVTDADGNWTQEFTPRAGSYYVSVSPVSGCSVTGSGYTDVLAVTPGAVLETEVEVACGPALLRVTAPTTGTNPDTEYTVTLWYLEWWYYYDVPIELGVLEANGTLTVEAPFAGWFWASLSGVAANCTVQTANPTAVFFIGHGTTYDVSFPVTCAP